MFNKKTTTEYIDFLMGKSIVMIWRCRNWPEEDYAMVVLMFFFSFQCKKKIYIYTIEMLMNSCLCRRDYKILLAKAAF